MVIGTFNVRFAATDEDRRTKGLMFSEPLKEDEVAFFIFPRAARYAFWNKNVDYPIDLAFLDENRRVVDFGHLKAQQKSSISPAREAKFVVEAKSGLFRQIGARVGDIMNYDPNEGKVTITATS